MSICKALFFVLRGFFVSRRGLVLENLALRQQLLVQQRTIKRPKLQNRDRLFWACLSRLWADWRSTLITVKPETVVRWHRQRFKLYWRRKSQAGKVGRPKISREIRDLIRQMSRENLTWGAPRIQSELALLGFELADSTVAKYMDIDEVLIAPRSPWQNPFAERVIGSIRRECLDHFIIFNERHLYQVLGAYVEYYNSARTHLSLDRNSPVPRVTQLPSQGKVVSIPQLGGLHHHYKRVA